MKTNRAVFGDCSYFLSWPTLCLWTVFLSKSTFYLKQEKKIEMVNCLEVKKINNWKIVIGDTRYEELGLD